ncbi:MAG TPA: prenyltransferase [Thermoplasmata archaeon]|jgi:1,4-dihydroxy-2-naphthoate octaprenyltransferase|nr:prenyltransferase [Thermoplasmata archaeon]
MATAPAATQATHGQLWFRALRAPFLVASVIPVLLGGALAAFFISNWPFFGLFFRPGLFLLTLAGAVSIHLATNMLNDNFDFRSGNDQAVTHQNPFAGGGRVLTQGVLNVNAHLAVAFGFLALGSLLGLYLVSQTGTALLLIGLVGMFAALFYVAPPIRLAHRGLGELFVGLSFGPLVVMGTYFVQTLRFDWGPLFLSIAFGLLVAAILWINEFPDVDADVSVGKRTLMARLGYERSVGVYFYLVALAYVLVLVAVLAGGVPPTALLPFLTLPTAVKNYRHLRAHARDPMALIPANAGTVMLTLQFGTLATVGVAVGLLY